MKREVYYFKFAGTNYLGLDLLKYLLENVKIFV